MSSILTNTSAMIALQTMKGINTNLEKVQSEISTGKDVATARDNAAVWAISKVMESDVEAFQGISDSLALGSSTVGVARQAAETVTDLLTALLLVFVDVLKELPATLILRPFNFNTLAVRAFELASDERLAEAAAPALLIVITGILPVLLLARTLTPAREAHHADH